MAQSLRTSHSSSEISRPEMPATPWRIVAVGVVALIAGVAVVRFLGRETGVRYAGRITARTIPLTVEQPGILAQWLIREGDPIQMGMPIVSITNSSLVERERQIAAEIARLKSDLERAHAQAELDLEWRTKDVNAEIFTARLQSAELLEEKYRHEMERVALSDVLNSNSTALWMPRNSVFDSIVLQESENQQGRLNTVLRVEAATNSADVCSAQVEMCEEQVTVLEELRDSLPERVRRSVGVDVLERQLADSEEELERISAEEPEHIVVSPVIGHAGVFLKQSGVDVHRGDRLVEIFDDVQRYIVVEIPSGDADVFQTGQEFPLVFPGDVERSGRVTQVAPQAIASRTRNETVVRVHLEPAGLLWPHVPIESQIFVRVP